MLRVPYADLYAALLKAMQQLGLNGERAALCARLFAETTRDGVYTHGLNRFPRFAAMVRNGSINVNAEPERTASFGSIERWDGHRGPGNLSAYAAMQRTIALARQNGIGAVALANTNHWMRGGTYGWQAADAGAIGLCWTNTMPNVPPWGGLDAAIGNNPLVIAVPRAAGNAVLDIAMSQFSYGALESYSKRGELLPVDGGFDAEGNLTRDPAAIEATQRLLPIGYWKGSGLTVMLDMIAAMLAVGNATHQIAADPLRETGLSQVFLAMQPAALGDEGLVAQIPDAIVESLHRSKPVQPDRPVRYPGENTLRLREENVRLGLPIDPAVWSAICDLAAAH
jgi:3-dehydro-L-gulonate 2-dehydrogenase